MYYQLIHHDGNNSCETVAESPSFANHAEAVSWFNTETAKHKLPEGRFWGLIDEKHVSFKKHVVETEAPVDTQTPLTFEQVQALTKERELQTRFETFDRNARLAKYIAAFPG